MSNIHNTAVIHPKANVADNVTVGPFCVVGEHVTLHEGVVLSSHVSVNGRTEIGKGTKVFPFAVIGEVPQDLKYHDEDSSLVIGENNKIREHVTIHLGTEQGGMITKIGDNNLFMVGVHIAHDCIIGNNTVFANNVTLAGHVTVEDNVVFGGLSGAHQFCRIGRFAMIGGMSGVHQDVIPFATLTGTRDAHLSSMNLVGLKRAKFPKEEIIIATKCFDIFARDDISFSEKQEKIATEFKDSVVANTIIEFINNKGEKARGFTMP